MKKIIVLFFCFAFSIFFYSNSIAADATASTTITEKFSDGSYIETVIMKDREIIPFSASTIKGKKTDTYKSKTGTVLWSITVHGSFSFNGSSAKCTAASISTSCPNAHWKLSNKSAVKSGATAKASVTAKRYIGNSLAQTLNHSVTLTCSKNDVFS